MIRILLTLLMSVFLFGCNSEQESLLTKSLESKSQTDSGNDAPGSDQGDDQSKPEPEEVVNSGGQQSEDDDSSEEPKEEVVIVSPGKDEDQSDNPGAGEENPKPEIVVEKPNTEGDKPSEDTKPNEEVVEEKPQTEGDKPAEDTKPNEEVVEEKPQTEGDKPAEDSKPNEEVVDEKPETEGDKPDEDTKPNEEVVDEKPETEEDDGDSDQPPVAEVTPTPVEEEKPKLVFVEAVDSFIQQGEQKDMDLLFVIDNSGSMKDDQESLKRNIPAFVEKLADKRLNFRVAVTTTGESAGKICSHKGNKYICETKGQTKVDHLGEIVNETIEFKSSDSAKEIEAKYKKFAEIVVNIGTVGNGKEKGLESMQQSMKLDQKYNKMFFDEGFAERHLSIVIVSDEVEQSKEGPDFYVKLLQESKKAPFKSVVHSVIKQVHQSNEFFENLLRLIGLGKSKGSHNGHKYQAVSVGTGGLTLDMDNDYADTLSSIAEDIIVLSDSVALSKKPYDPKAIKVMVNGSENHDWSYDEAKNAIRFDEAPSQGDQIIVKYMILQ